ncbi:hypothetical protein OJAV_G00105980 [Oryzias javanicus]|uniref:Uncharacterized protein n=1 Tax=Oryzias javanicus TaxID=123683 RepID=A0A3S2MT41_ORYJA|nr:hypothetical protein OJAV_G00105980 [Oryzias javanicus]
MTLHRFDIDFSRTSRLHEDFDTGRISANHAETRRHDALRRGAQAPAVVFILRLQRTEGGLRYNKVNNQHQ